MAKIDDVLAAVQNLDARIDAMISRVEALLGANLDAQLQQILDITNQSTAKVDSERP